MKLMTKIEYLIVPKGTEHGSEKSQFHNFGIISVIICWQASLLFFLIQKQMVIDISLKKKKKKKK